MWRMAAGLLLAGAMWGAGREVVLFDTDSCLFCDDGAALVMLLRSPAQVSVPGITVVPGNTWPAQGAEYMFHILDLLKKPQIPVYTGAHVPMVHTAAMAKEYERRWGKLEYIGAFADNPAVVKPAPGAKLTGRKPRHDAAVEFLISQIERYPGEVTILALGPMTNIALALRMKPEIETKIKRIVFMGGNVHVPGNASPAAEFNFWFDPEAAHKVLRAAWPAIDIITVDASLQVPFTPAVLADIAKLKSPAAQYIARYSKPESYMWDELAAAILLDPSLATQTRALYMDIDLSHGPSYGHTLTWSDQLKPDTPVRKVRAHIAVHAPRFYRAFLDLIARQ